MIHLQDINKTYQGAQPLHVLKLCTVIGLVDVL